MAGLRARKIKIHNDSDETITLIPFCRYDREKLHMEFPVRTDLVRDIQKKNCETVKCEDYDLGGKVAGAQIHMLFRAEKCSVSVVPGNDEKVFLCTGLAAKTEWHLSLDKKKQVIGGPDNAVGPTSSGANAAAQAALGANAAGTQDGSLLERLREEVRQLTRQVEILQNRVADLEKRFNEKNPA